MIVDSVAGITSAAPSPSTPRNPINAPALDVNGAAADPAPKIASPASSARRRPNRSPIAPAGSSRDANARLYASMIQASLVCEACVSVAIEGSATFSDDIADTTVASARQVTASTRPCRPAAPSADGEPVAPVAPPVGAERSLAGAFVGRAPAAAGAVGVVGGRGVADATGGDSEVVEADEAAGVVMVRVLPARCGGVPGPTVDPTTSVVQP